MRFDYVECTVKDLVVQTEIRNGRIAVKDVSLKGERVRPTGRFWQSLFSRFGFNNTFFRYFEYPEVFERVAERAHNDKLLCCVERSGNDGALLACSNPARPVVRYDDLMNILDKYGHDGGGVTFSYDGGVVRSVHNPKFTIPVSIGGDAFKNQFALDVPIDGYGKPSIYLSVMRLVCSNGAVAYAKAFRSLLSLGKGKDSFDYTIARALDSFNNEDGFEALRQRLEASQQSWASIYETQKLYRYLVRMHARGQTSVNKALLKGAGGDGARAIEDSPLITSYNNMVGDLSSVYGLANLDALTTKRQRTLPAPCKVYDLFNFASEVATHHSTVGGNRQMQSFIGELIGSGEEYDLEGTCEKFSDWRDFLVLDEDAIEAKCALNTAT